jgi:formate hydrogenlyase subunit 3/multisubunit Na+/H+ antiporter MnhD subunit
MLSMGIGMRYRVPEAVAVGFLLLLAHAVMKGLAFLCKGACANPASDAVDDLRGTLRRQPLVAVVFSLALAGLIGVPPLAGFSAKWFLLLQALRTASAPKPGTPPPALIYVGLVVFAFNTVASLGYFLPMIGAILGSPPLEQPEADQRARTSAWMVVPLVILALAVIAIGVYPGPWLAWMDAIAAYLM